jgi:hypothetical protein
VVRDPHLRVYVVWVPILESDRGAPDGGTLALIPDKRALHFWDAEGLLPALFPKTLQLPAGRPAWDVYLVYPQGVEWTANPPRPVYWQHQLSGLQSASRLDGKIFAARLGKVLGSQPRNQQRAPRLPLLPRGQGTESMRRQPAAAPR